MGYYYFYIAGVLGPAFIAYLLISGAKRVKQRSEASQSSSLWEYGSLVSTFMYIGAVIALLSICLVLSSLILP